MTRTERFASKLMIFILVFTFAICLIGIGFYLVHCEGVSMKTMAGSIIGLLIGAVSIYKAFNMVEGPLPEYVSQLPNPSGLRADFIEDRYGNGACLFLFGIFSCLIPLLNLIVSLVR